MRESKASKEQIELRRQQMEDYQKWVEQKQMDFEEEKEERLALRNGRFLKQWLYSLLKISCLHVLDQSYSCK